MSRIVISGSAGFIGNHFVEQFISERHGVAVADALSTGRRVNLPASTFLAPVPMASAAAVKLIPSFRPEFISHFACASPGGAICVEAGAASAFIAQARAGLPPRIHGRGNRVRDFIRVHTSIPRMAERVRTRFPEGHGVEKSPAIPGEQARSVLDCSKAKEVLGWVPAAVLDEGPPATIRWFAEADGYPVSFSNTSRVS